MDDVHRLRAGMFAAWVVLLLGGVLSDHGVAQAESPPSVQRKLRLGVEDAVRLATTHHSSLKVSFFNHLIDRTRIAEAEAAFEPVGFVSADGGVSEVSFPQIFPTGNINPDGTPEFFQTIVTDSSVTADWLAGARGLLPTGATWQLQVRTDYRDREAGGLVNPSFQTATTATFTQPILRGAWLQYNWASTRQAEFVEQQSRQRFRGDVLDTILQVHEAYWNYVFAIQDLKVKRRSLSVARELLDINRIKVETGVFAPIEITSAEAGVASRVTDVLVAENQVKETEDILKRLVLPFRGLGEWKTSIIPVDTVSETRWRIPDLDAAIQLALKERPELLEARIQLRSRDLSVAVADNETLPKLDIKGSANFTGLDATFEDSFLGGFGPTGAESWSVGMALEFPLGNKAARAKLSRSRLERDQALYSYRDLQLAAVADVRKAWRAVKISEKTIASRKKSAELKEEELRNERVKLESKVSTNFEVLRIEDDLAQRRSELIRTLADYRINLARLARAIGSSLDVLKWPRN